MEMNGYTRLRDLDRKQRRDLNRIVRKQRKEHKGMNGKQAARAAAKRIEELEFVNAAQARDIQDYNACILSMISGDSACLWCEERTECHSEAKDGKNGLLGCPEWWLKYRDAGGDQNGVSEKSETEIPVQHLAEQG